jgi:uncharacterized membrane protein YfcA
MLFLASVFALGVLSGATAAVVGFGIGSLMTPLLLTRLEPTLAVAAVALPHLVATALRFIQHRRAVERAVIVRFGLPSALGGLTGAFLLGAMDDVWLFALLGALLVATAVANLTSGFSAWLAGRRSGQVRSLSEGWKPRPADAVVLGLLSGLFGGLAGNQGGLRAAGLLAFDLPPRAYLATGTAVALLIDAARTPVYLLRAGTELLALATPIAVATAGCVIGTVLGEKVFLGLSSTVYRRVVGAAVGVLGVWLLARALTF